MIEVVGDYRMVGGGEIRGYPGRPSAACCRGLRRAGRTSGATQGGRTMEEDNNASVRRYLDRLTDGCGTGPRCARHR